MKPAKLGKAATSAAPTAAAASSGVKASSPSARSTSTVRHDLKGIDKSIAKLSKKETELEAALADIGDNHDQLAEIGAELAAVQAQLASDEERWLELSEELEDR